MWKRQLACLTRTHVVTSATIGRIQGIICGGIREGYCSCRQRSVDGSDTCERIGEQILKEKEKETITVVVCSKCKSTNMVCTPKYFSTGGDMEQVEWKHECKSCGHVDVSEIELN
jgi:hypothetical protein